MSGSFLTMRRLLPLLLACTPTPKPTPTLTPTLTLAQTLTLTQTLTQTPTPTPIPAPLACLSRYYMAPDVPVTPEEAAEVYSPAYKTGPITPITDPDHDPGRFRIDSLFFATYGRTAHEVQAALVPVRIGGATVMVHKKISEPLARVATRISDAMKRDASLARFFTSLGGTFNWRTIAGTSELSMHAWGIAIDLSTPLSHYWRNEPRDRPLVWKNTYPRAIVDAFEAEGFIWGGRWYHFDTMHFEYRPELLDPSCYPK